MKIISTFNKKGASLLLACAAALSSYYQLINVENKSCTHVTVKTPVTGSDVIHSPSVSQSVQSQQKMSGVVAFQFFSYIPLPTLCSIFSNDVDNHRPIDQKSKMKEFIDKPVQFSNSFTKQNLLY